MHNWSKRKKLLAAACVLWLAVIWGHPLVPADASQAESERLRWALLPFLTVHAVRKLAHFTEFFILGALLRQLFAAAPRQTPVLPVLTGLLCALGDETIQLFIPGRSGQVSDVWLDFSGVLTAVLLTGLLARVKRRKPC